MKAILRFPDSTEHAYEGLRSVHPINQALLRRLYHENGRAACTCKPDGPEFYVANRNERYILARMPGTTDAHNIRCPLYVIPLPAASPQIKTPVAGHQGWHTRLSTSEDERPRVVGLKGVLGTMLEEAGFHNWWPKSKGRRRYKQMRKFFGVAANHIYLGSNCLDSHLFIPERWVGTHAKSIASRMHAVFKTMQGPDDPDGVHLIAGIVRRVRWMPGGFGYLELSNLPKYPGLYIHQDLAKDCRANLDRLLSDTVGMRHSSLCLVLAAVHPIHDASPDPDYLSKVRIDHIGIQQLSPEYIPVESDEMNALVRILVRHNRIFSVSLAYDGDQSGVVWLKDAGDEPVPLTIGGFAPNEGWLWNPEDHPLSPDWCADQSGPWPMPLPPIIDHKPPQTD